MDELTANARWDDPNHRATPGREHAELESMEAITGHTWDRTDAGHIKFHSMNRKCQGPLCTSCGFIFCVECGAPENIYSCGSTARDFGLRNGKPGVTESAQSASSLGLESDPDPQDGPDTNQGTARLI